VQTNYLPGVGYLVRTHWVHQLWQKGKIRDDAVRDCAAHYKCLTKSFEDAIAVINRWNREQQVEKLRVKRMKFEKDTLQKSKVPLATAWELWNSQKSFAVISYGCGQTHPK
jgi:hypothetical protein